ETARGSLGGLPKPRTPPVSSRGRRQGLDVLLPLQRKLNASLANFVPAVRKKLAAKVAAQFPVPSQPSSASSVDLLKFERRINMMIRKTLAVLATIGAVGAAAVTAPAPAEARGIGPGLAFGLAAGALTAGAIAASHPYYYGYGYGPGYYYGPPAVY